MAEIELSQMIIELRKTFETAMAEGKDKPIQFLVNETELELNIKMVLEANVGVKFYLFKSGIDGTSEQSQRITIKLQPMIRADDGTYKKLAINDVGTR